MLSLATVFLANALMNGAIPPCVRIVVASVFRTIGRGAEVRFEWDIILKRIKKQSLVS